jgi:hypothetical protein
MRALSTSAVLVVSALLLSGCASGGSGSGGSGSGGDTTGQPGNGAGITVHGTGMVSGKPDTVTITLGVQTQAPSASAALSANNQQADALVNALKAKGVEDKDVQTSQLSVDTTNSSPTGAITGYEVNNKVTVTLHDVNNAGAVIDAAGHAAGDAIRVQSLDFSIADDSALRQQARADAVHQAKEQAQQLAQAAGVHLGDLRSINESTSSTPPTPMYRQMAPEAASGVPVQPGSEKLSVTVNLVYDIG